MTEMPNPKVFRFLMEAPGVLDWLKHLRDSQRIDAHRLDAIARDILVIKTSRTEEAPVYLRALSAIGAIISGFLFLYLLYLFGLFDLSMVNLSVNGLVFIGLASLLYRLGMKKTSLSGDFYIQLALTFLQVGKFALVAGLGQIVHDIFELNWFWTISAILGLVMVISFVVFPSSIERFVAAFVFLASLWVSLLADSPRNLELIGFDLLLVAHILALAALLRWPLLRQSLTSFYDALLLSLCLAIGLIESFVNGGESYWGDLSEKLQMFLGFGYKWSIQVTLAITLSALILWVAGRKGRLGQQTEPIIAAFVGVLALALLSNAGILLAMGLMILGFATHRQVHILLGLLFALVFGFIYYYMLDLTLLQKSLILIASGAILLIGSGYIYWRGWSHSSDEDAASNATDGPAPSVVTRRRSL
ncbi:DUF4401 domain-containing protein [Cohaesibacter haloalkalitolerans]|uniref:DUF4401 domain-containing protein n=1 Tax=Cohaesibacter haloalkalitolerans TaxID=1162980 RepID=UPI000E658165|nr:DUF4401 domain-containing protein [Cohaesibacter haloalkalitolerans]